MTRRVLFSAVARALIAPAGPRSKNLHISIAPELLARIAQAAQEENITPTNSYGGPWRIILLGTSARQQARPSNFPV